ncbi:MAG: flavin reductase [Candidatus Margulisiibacteriota bacterium]|nr:MAG: flavin reductase [Candidatus Margulisbacteria bacterium GWD2_39_127]OGI02892.1 MAG: flavin reductase [Candidatus Margulisbacteria bacterium GWF2_38_17]OGI06812.1 MAG: flavin reductase [Candidatus Margulisbacteria bacterium GWE2_39_32]PZM83000.1 MAG: flavin reductase [Candidatus Margulisiibacteriota bacterium]HAR62160.1 flavin reductase [Candidatus Margulisiibacteriota bacterium]
MNALALYQINYGVYIVSSIKDGILNGQTANTVFQVTAKPPMLAISIHKENLTHEFITKSNLFSVSILEKETPTSLIGKFGFRSGREINKFEGINYLIGKTGVPIVTENTLAYLELEVANALDVGTHTLFLGNIVEGEIIREGEPMTYSYYHEAKKGTSPKTAPTFRNPQ